MSASTTKEIPEEVYKKLIKNLKSIRRALSNIKDLGYSTYLSPGMLHVCDGDTHVGSNSVGDYSVVVTSIDVCNIDAGDW